MKLTSALTPLDPSYDFKNNTIKGAGGLVCADWGLPDSTCAKFQYILDHTSKMENNDNRYDEMPEQLLATHYVKKGDVVLELGANIGRNTLVIAKILEGEGTLYSSESNESYRKRTLSNLKLNNLSYNSYHVIPAISKVPLQQDSWWSTRIKSDHPTTDGWVNIETTKLPAENFNTLIVDCEGCLLPITQKFPQILSTVNTIIIENDWKSLEDFKDMHDLFNNAGLHSSQCYNGPWGARRDCFYEVLER